MLAYLINKKISFLKERTEEAKILLLYRYLSLLITCIFYLINDYGHQIEKKIFIIGCLTISAIILSYLYMVNEKRTKNIKLLILIETIGNSLLLIPSGGFESPFIWYTLNTILISSVYLKKRHCWTNILIYLFASAFIVRVLQNQELHIFEFIDDQSNLILSFILVIAAVQMWSVYIDKTREKNIKLEKINFELEYANEMIRDSIDHIMALYQSVHLLTNQRNKQDLIKLLIDYTKRITRQDVVFYYDISQEINEMIIDDHSNTINQLEENIIKNSKSILEQKIPKEVCIEKKKFIVTPVKSTYLDYGILGIEISDEVRNSAYKNTLYQLQFLSSLSSMILERFYLEEVNERLLITEEQNRIANEIHDSVLQRLFGMSCGVFSLMRNIDQCTTEEIKNELNFIRRSTDTAMKELRAKIYGLSWQNSGNNSFSSDVNNYIDDIKRLHNIKIVFKIIGKDVLLTSIQKKALYRMVCEGIGNSVRHGMASEIKVNLDIKVNITILEIRDNGIGFDIDRALKSQSNGLGLKNLYNLVESLNGEIKIDSKEGKGTEIKVSIPNSIVIIKGEEVV